MQNIQAKSVLAKLLAEENISIEHRKVHTAYFDLANRTMVLPIWENMSPELYDLLIGHETSHALNTPKEGWHNVVSNDRQIKTFLNIIEDARIERLQKLRYPGLSRSFLAGYRELMERDFFGISGLDINTLPIADRINLHFKGGSALAINFSEVEQNFISRVNLAETWSDVVALANELKSLSDEEKPRLQQMMDDLVSEAEDLQEELNEILPESFSDANDFDDFDDAEADENDDGEDFGTPSDTSSEPEDSTVQESDMSELTDEEREAVEDIESKLEEIKKKMAPIQNALEDEGSHTDESFRANESKLVDADSTKEPFYSDTSRVDYKPYMEDYKSFYKEPIFYWDKWANQSAIEEKEEQFSTWLARQKNIVSSMAHTFFSKQKAHEMKRTRVAKTGEINVNKLWSYNTSEDIFLQKTLVASGKNHGMIFYLDMSQSMYDHMHDTIHQLLKMVMFARKISVPFEVFGFTSSHRNQECPDLQVGDFVPFDLYMPNLFSSRMSKKEFDSAVKQFWFVSKSFMRKEWQSRRLNTTIHLGSTPLVSALVCGAKIAKDFQTANNVEILNTMILTDGEPTDRVNALRQKTNWNNEEVLHRDSCDRYDQYPVLVEDGVQTRVKAEYTHMEHLATAIEHYRKTTGSRMYNYHLIGGRKDLERQCYFGKQVGKKNEFSENLVSTFNKQGYVVSTDQFYDYKFIIRTSALSSDNTELQVKGDLSDVKYRKSALLAGFKKMGKGKKTERLLANQLAELVA